MGKKINFGLLVIIGSGLFSHFADAGESVSNVAKCENFVDVKSKSRESFNGTALMQVAGILENQGEHNFEVAFAPPAHQCVVETLDVENTKVAIMASPWEKGDATLLFQAVAEAPTGSRKVLVVYDGLVSFVSKETVFHVSEKRDGVVSWYAMYKDQPTYASFKQLLINILTGKAAPLMSVRWPPNAKEGEVLVFDSKRLK